MGISAQHDQPGICISINIIESPQNVLIPVLKLKQTSRKYHVSTIFVEHYSKLTYVCFSEITTAKNMFKQNMHLKNMQQLLAYKFKNTMPTMVPSILDFSNKTYLPQIKPLLLVLLIHSIRT